MCVCDICWGACVPLCTCRGPFSCTFMWGLGIERRLQVCIADTLHAGLFCRPQMAFLKSLSAFIGVEVSFLFTKPDKNRYL